MMSEEEELKHCSDINQSDLSHEIENGEGEFTDEMLMSLNALSGNTDLNTFRVKGFLENYEVQILIDSGTTHCFLYEKVAYKLGCSMEYTTPMVVSVADGSKMVSRVMCPDFAWIIQGILSPISSGSST
ncbi:hypothetical protein BUALT_Bualt16G0001300 [Buddleja alternifolia]|uniref:Uncharacterized protein n=1 Tax=Buddleja alternifolia TaxID=168488 RepID=A0AAV6W5L6_9LAMI|nr:hypothetical protein BUALT_Bualt16G0001300 [Buddleja alternifolia]